MIKHPYNVIIGRHLLVTDSLKEYVEKKLHKLERISDKIIDIHVTFENQRADHHAAILLHVGHYTIKAEAVHTDTYAAFDKAITKLKALLLKYKDKVTDHHKMSHADKTMMNIYNTEITDTGLVNDAIEEENAKKEAEYLCIT